MKFDFENDMKKSLSENVPYGIKLPKRNEIHKSLIDHLTLFTKLIPITPRDVKFAPEIKAELHNHPKKDIIETIASRLSRGQDVNLFQSRRLFQVQFHDHLVYEWNIYHLHLSKEKDKKSPFVKQVNQLLFVYISDKEAIILGTDTHKKGVFGDTKWQEVLHDYFPYTISKYKDDVIKDLSPKVDAQDRQILWDKGYTLGMTKIRDQVYINPGVGRTTSGHSMLVVTQADETVRWLYTISEQFEKHYSLICTALNFNEAAVKFQLRIGESTFEIIETDSDWVLLTFPETVNVTPIIEEE